MLKRCVRNLLDTQLYIILHFILKYIYYYDKLHCKFLLLIYSHKINDHVCTFH